MSGTITIGYTKLDLIEYNDEQLKLLKDTVCKNSTDSEFKLFLYIAKKTGLDPFAKQIYAVKRWNSELNREEMTVQTSIDGFRVVAERSGKYAGQIGPFWCGKDGVWKDIWLEDDLPMAAKVGVVRTDFREPIFAVANFEAYKQTKKDGSLAMFWKKMPELMIAKVAESLALRKAFPQDLSGIYTSDEMSQAQSDEVEAKPKEIEKKEDPIIKQKIKKSDADFLAEKGKEFGLDMKTMNELIYKLTKKTKWSDIYIHEIPLIIEEFGKNKTAG